MIKNEVKLHQVLKITEHLINLEILPKSKVTFQLMSNPSQYLKSKAWQPKVICQALILMINLVKIIINTLIMKNLKELKQKKIIIDLNQRKTIKIYWITEIRIINLQCLIKIRIQLK